MSEPEAYLKSFSSFLLFLAAGVLADHFYFVLIRSVIIVHIQPRRKQLQGGLLQRHDLPKPRGAVS